MNSSEVLSPAAMLLRTATEARSGPARFPRFFAWLTETFPKDGAANWSAIARPSSNGTETLAVDPERRTIGFAPSKGCAPLGEIARSLLEAPAPASRPAPPYRHR